jgi:hypothetical protein
MALNHITSCSLFINWLQDHLIPCPFKYLTGIDCPGCGFQRSVLALVSGNLQESFALYPPAVPILMAATWWLADSFFKLDTSKNVVKKIVFIITALIIAVSYTVKISNIGVA